VFNATKQDTESRAKKLANKLIPIHNFEEVRDALVTRKRDELDEDEEELASAITKGVAWHHADVPDYAKNLIEDWFNEGEIKVLFATTTLAYGINTPTKTVIIMDIYRSGRKIPVYEWLQMAGRAGRAGYSEEGIVYTIVRSESDAQEIELRYHSGQIESCEPRLNDEDYLRKTILELIYKGFSDKEVIEFMSNTYTYSYTSMSGELLLGNDLVEIIKSEVAYLRDNGFVKPSLRGLTLTEFGKAVMDFLWNSSIDVPGGGADPLRFN